MFVQDNLENIEVVSGGNFPNPAFLLTSVAVVASPIVLFAIGGVTASTLLQTGLIYASLALLSFIPFSTGTPRTKLQRTSNTGASLFIRKN